MNVRNSKRKKDNITDLLELVLEIEKLMRKMKMQLRSSNQAVDARTCHLWFRILPTRLMSRRKAGLTDTKLTSQ